jgi:hypothetical protein
MRARANKPILKGFHPYFARSVRLEWQEQGMAVRKTKTHFEQVPLAQVLRRLERDADNAQIRLESGLRNSSRSVSRVVVEKSASETGPYSVRKPL